MSHCANHFTYPESEIWQLILMKIIKIVATRCQILKLNAPTSISAGALQVRRGDQHVGQTGAPTRGPANFCNIATCI